MKRKLKLDVLGTKLIDLQNHKIIKHMTNYDFYDSLLNRKKSDPPPEFAVAYLDPFISSDWYDIQMVDWVKLTDIKEIKSKGGEIKYNVEYDRIKQFYIGEYKVKFGYDSVSNTEVPKKVTFNDVYFD